MRDRLILSIAAAALAISLGSGNVWAQGRRAAAGARPPAATATDEDAIRAQARDFAAAFAKGDAAAIADTWTAQAEYYEESGAELHGRDAIQQAFAEFFAAHPGARIDFQIDSIRFPSKDLAVEEGISSLTHAGPELPESTRYLVIHVREDGQWRTAISREFGAMGDRLQDLAWLVGDWSAATADRETKIGFQWNETKTALSGTFTTIVDGKTAASGHQRIILDPQTGQIRSWIFDDEGGHGVAFWTHDGNKWLLDAKGIAPDGAGTAATNVLTRLNDNEIMWRSLNRAAGETELAPTDPIKLTRVKSAK